MQQLRRFRLLTLILAAAVVVAAAACNPSGGGSGTAASGGSGSGVVLGHGSVPETVPDGFPIPNEAVIGATMVDPGRGVTEVVMSLPAALSSAVDYYTKNLSVAGYELTSSGGSEVDWELIFLDDEVQGVIKVKSVGEGLSTVTVQFSDV